MSYFSDKIKSLRIQNNYTQKEVAEAIGISQGNYSSLEAGRNAPSLTVLQNLSDFYEELIDSLVQSFRIVEDYSELTDREKVLLKKYRRLTIRDCVEIECIIDMKIEKERKKAEEQEEDEL